MHIKKFGGTSVADIEKIKKIAKQIAEENIEEGLIIVVSAMGKTTDELTRMAKQIANKPNGRELDMLLTAGERISMSLLSIALQDYGLKAISFTGSQSGIITNSIHGNARITDVTAFRIKQELQNNKIVIVAGFQGVSLQKEVTTLGRGGSDTTAVALAKYLNAEACEICTDVDGVYTADPRLIKNAKIIKQISHKQMLALSESGAKVLHTRAIEFALKYNIDLYIKSSFKKSKGTLVTSMHINEQKNVTAIADSDDLLLLNIESDNLTSLFDNISTNGIDLFCFEVFAENKCEIAIKKDCYSHYHDFFAKFKHSVKTDIAAVTLVGTHISRDLNFVSELLKTLQNNDFTVISLKTIEMGIRLFIKKSSLKNVLKHLHTKYIG